MWFVTALAPVTIFWAVLIGLLIWWRRSWLPVLVFPLGEVAVVSLFCVLAPVWVAIGSIVVHTGLLLVLSVVILIDVWQHGSRAYLERPPVNPDLSDSCSVADQT